MRMKVYFLVCKIGSPNEPAAYNFKYVYFSVLVLQIANLCNTLQMFAMHTILEQTANING